MDIKRIEYISLCRDIWDSLIKEFRANKDTGLFAEERHNKAFIYYAKREIVLWNIEEFKKKYPNINGGNTLMGDLSEYSYCPACMECRQVCYKCFLLPLWDDDEESKYKMIYCEKKDHSPYAKARMLLTITDMRQEHWDAVILECQKIVDYCEMLLNKENG